MHFFLNWRHALSSSRNSPKLRDDTAGTTIVKFQGFEKLKSVKCSNFLFLPFKKKKNQARFGQNFNFDMAATSRYWIRNVKWRTHMLYENQRKLVIRNVEN